jgi:hydrogenase nickel incorporation protein HypB
MNSLILKDCSVLNEKAASANRQAFEAARVTALTIVGPAGAGKSSAIEAFLLRRSPPLRSGIIMGNPTADRQISRIRRHGYPSVAIRTNHLTAKQIQSALPHFDLPALDLLLIEADIDTLSSAESDLGQHLCVAVFSAAGSHEKLNDYPYLIFRSDLVIMTKIDVLPFVNFDVKAFSQDIARLKSNPTILQLSVQSGQGVQEWIDWIDSHRSVNWQGRRS